MEAKGSKIVTAVFYIVMCILFLIQCHLCIRKLRDQKVVEDVSVEKLNVAALPNFTVCVVPGHKNLPPGKLTASYDWLDELCPNVMDYKSCLESSTYNLQDVFIGVVLFQDSLNGSVTYEPVEMEPHISSIVLGACFKPKQIGFQLISAFSGISLQWNVKNLERVNVFLVLHNFKYSLPLANRFDPSYPVFLSSSNPKPGIHKILMFSRTIRERISTEENKCSSKLDDDFVQCYEQFQTKRVGCASPWSKFEQMGKMCESKEEFERLMKHQQQMGMTTFTRFSDLTGCIPPCTVQEYGLVENELFVGSQQGGNNRSITTIYPLNMKTKHVKENYLYDVNNFIGELGGSLGFFLGFSIVSIYTFCVVHIPNATQFFK